jgi:hypothetical protein
MAMNWRNCLSGTEGFADSDPSLGKTASGVHFAKKLHLPLPGRHTGPLQFQRVVVQPLRLAVQCAGVGNDLSGLGH